MFKISLFVIVLIILLLLWWKFTTSLKETFDNFIDKNKLNVYQGHSLPFHDTQQGYHLDHSKYFPSIDGMNDSNKSMFMFTYNKCLPECCRESPFSCDKGCICLSKSQKHYLGNRGNNTSYKCHSKTA